jgi:type II secretion system protein H
MRARGAFTLIELLLVLCMLVIAATMAWPKLTGVVAGQRLRSGADQVRVEWSRARVQAMSKGQIVLFRFVPNGNQFRLENRASDESVDQDPTDTGSAPGAASDAAASRPRQLPRGVQFAGGQVAADSRAVQAENDQSQPPISEDGGSWSDPIFFYPDGTTSTARIALTNEYHRRMEISLRGLTGVARVQEASDGAQR